MKKTIILTVLLSAVCWGGATAQTSSFQVVTPSGHTLSFSIEDSVAVVGSNTGVSGYLVIPDSVTYNDTVYPVAVIGQKAFYNAMSLRTVELPATLKEIRAQAFRYCRNLYTVAVPEDIDTVYSSAFSYVRHITYSGTLASAPWGASRMNGYETDSAVYSDASRNELIMVHPLAATFTVDTSVHEIASNALYGCDSLTTLNYNAISAVGGPLTDTNVTQLTIGGNVQTLVGDMFKNMKGLTSVDLPDNVTTITGDNPFTGCTGLTAPIFNSTYFVMMEYQLENSNYTVPEGPSIVVADAFHEAELTKLTLTASIDSINSLPASLDTLVFTGIIPPAHEASNVLAYRFYSHYRYGTEVFDYADLVVSVPCGSLHAYRDKGWDLVHTTSDCATARLTIITTEDSIYSFDSLRREQANYMPPYYNSGIYEPGDTVDIRSERLYYSGANPWEPWEVKFVSGYFVGWSDGSTELNRQYVVSGDDTLVAHISRGVPKATLTGADFTMPVGVFGNMSYDGSGATHRVATDTTATILASSLWVAADTSHVAAQFFMEHGNDFVPGPLRLDGTTNTETALAYNRVWHLTREQIDQHIAHCGDTGYTPIDDIATWPGNGPSGCAEQLAPYYDADSNGLYQPMAGDYPIIRGDEAVFSIFNDVCSHTESRGTPLGIEVHCMTYAFRDAADSSLGSTIFTHYEIFNRSAADYDSLYLGAWTDFDIGYSYDDYIGSDAGRSMYYGYNGDNEDGPGAGAFAGVPPAQSCTFLAGDMSSFVYYDNVYGINGNPTYAKDYYNYMRAIWRDGRHMKYGGNGLNVNTTEQEANYMYCGTTDPAFPDGDWTEADSYNSPFDRRGIGASGPHSLSAGSVKHFDLAYTTAFGIDSAWSSVVALQAATDEVRRQWQRDTTDSGRPFVYMPYSAPRELTGIAEAIRSELTLYPNPTTGMVYIDVPHDAVLQLFDMVGHCVMTTRVAQGKVALDLGRLPQGVYLVRVDGAVSRLVKR